jgi:Protein of unknown function (DUF2809)
MKNQRQTCLLVIVIIIALGILSRKLEYVPLYIGDLLYGSMIFFMARFLLVNSKVRVIIIIALSICFSIEFLQLYQGSWLLTIRNSLFGKYVLGMGFLWTDLFWYTIGICLAAIAEKLIFKPNKNLN